MAQERIKGYISFEELERYCTQNVEAIEAGDKSQEEANKEYDEKNGEPTQGIETVRLLHLQWSKGKKKAWKELHHSIQNWKKANGEGK